MSINSVPTQQVFSQYAELRATNDSVPDSTTAITSWQANSSMYSDLTSSDGWIDVRNFVEATIVGIATTHGATFTVEYKASSYGSAQSLVSATAVTAGNEAELYADTIKNATHIRVKEEASSSGSNGESTVGVYLI